MAGTRQCGGTTSSQLDEWTVRVLPRAVAYARTLLGRRGDAEDVVHDVLCRLFDHKEYNLIADGEKILFRSVTNACINRTQRRRNLLSLDSGFDDDTGWSAVIRAKSVPNPAEVAIARELHEAIGQGLDTLPPMQKAALELKAMQYSLKEIAQMLNVSPSNAGVLVHRARKNLAQELGPFLVAEDDRTEVHDDG